MDKTIYHRLRSAGVPRGYCLAVAQNDTKFSDVVYKEMQTKHVAVIVGEIRCGKTFMACKYLSHNMPPMNPNRYSGEWEDTDTPLFLTALELTSTRLDEFKSYIKPSGLVLDDLAWIPKHMVTSVFNVISYRVMAGTPTIITTRLTKQQLELYYGARLIELISLYGVVIHAKEHTNQFVESTKMGDFRPGDSSTPG